MEYNNVINESFKVVDKLFEKYIQEEIMTKSELDRRVDAVMDKHEARIDARFNNIDVRFQNIDVKFENIEIKLSAQMESLRSEFQSFESKIDRQFLKIDHRYNWIIGLIVTSVIGLSGVLFKFMSMLPVQ